MKDPVVLEWGAVLRKIREANQLSQSELARRCHVKQNMISRIEMGVTAPSLLAWIKLSKQLGPEFIRETYRLAGIDYILCHLLNSDPKVTILNIRRDEQEVIKKQSPALYPCLPLHAKLSKVQAYPSVCGRAIVERFNRLYQPSRSGTQGSIKGNDTTIVRPFQCFPELDRQRIEERLDAGLRAQGRQEPGPDMIFFN